MNAQTQNSYEILYDVLGSDARRDIDAIQRDGPEIFLQGKAELLRPDVFPVRSVADLQICETDTAYYTECGIIVLWNPEKASCAIIRQSAERCEKPA